MTRVLIVMLIAACGYNWLEVRRLQAQVTALQQKVSAQKRDLDQKRLGGDGFLDRAAADAGRARAALSRSDWKTAQKQLSQGVDDLKEGMQTPQMPEARRSLSAMQAQMKSLRDEADAFWHRSLPPAPRRAP